MRTPLTEAESVCLLNILKKTPSLAMITPSSRAMWRSTAA
jgi:hypothetical protein